MPDPRRLFDAKDIEAAALYANQVGSGAEDFYPLKVDANGYLLISLTVGSVSLSSTESTINNAVGNPVNVSLTSTKVTIESTGLNVTPTTTASTITNAAANPVPVTGNVNIATATLGTVTITGTVTPSTTASTITNAVGNPVNVSLTNTAVTVAGSVSLSSTIVTIGGIKAAVPTRVSSNSTAITGTTTSIIAAPSAGNHLRIVRLHAANGGSTATWLRWRDGAAGTQHYATYLPQNGVFSINLNLSGPLDLTTATRLDIVMSAAGSIEYEVDYFTVPD